MQRLSDARSARCPGCCRALHENIDAPFGVDHVQRLERIADLERPLVNLHMDESAVFRLLRSDCADRMQAAASSSLAVSPE